MATKPRKNAKPKKARKSPVKSVRQRRARRQPDRRRHKSSTRKGTGARRKVRVLAKVKRGVHRNRQRKHDKRVKNKARRPSAKATIKRLQAENKRLKLKLKKRKARRPPKQRPVKSKKRKARRPLKQRPVKSKKRKARRPPKQRPVKSKKFKGEPLIFIDQSVRDLLSGTLIDIPVKDNGGLRNIKNKDFNVLEYLVEKNRMQDDSFKYPQAVVVSIESGLYQNEKGESTTFLRAKTSPPDMVCDVENIKRFTVEYINAYIDTYMERIEELNELSDGEGLDMTGSDENSNPDKAEFVHIKWIY